MSSDDIRAKILYVLSIYPYLSPSMLQVGIGTNLAPYIWKPVMEEMISQGTLTRRQVGQIHPRDGKTYLHTVIGANQTYRHTSVQASS